MITKENKLKRKSRNHPAFSVFKLYINLLFKLLPGETRKTNQTNTKKKHRGCFGNSISYGRPKDYHQTCCQSTSGHQHRKRERTNKGNLYHDSISLLFGLHLIKSISVPDTTTSLVITIPVETGIGTTHPFFMPDRTMFFNCSSVIGGISG